MENTTIADNDHVTEFPPNSLRPILVELRQLVAASSTPVKIAVAETSTGGLISASLLSLPGASKFYAGGTTLYTLMARKAWGGWTDADIEAYQGPTEAVVGKLARNVCQTLNATHCIGESGATGPTAPAVANHNSVIGRTCLAVVLADDTVVTRTIKTDLGGDREANMVAFTQAALQLLRDVLAGSEKPVAIDSKL